MTIMMTVLMTIYEMMMTMMILMGKEAERVRQCIIQQPVEKAAVADCTLIIIIIIIIMVIMIIMMMIMIMVIMQFWYMTASLMMFMLVMMLACRQIPIMTKCCILFEGIALNINEISAAAAWLLTMMVSRKRSSHFGC